MSGVGLSTGKGKWVKADEVSCKGMNTSAIGPPRLDLGCYTVRAADELQCIATNPFNISVSIQHPSMMSLEHQTVCLKLVEVLAVIRWAE